MQAMCRLHVYKHMYLHASNVITFALHEVIAAAAATPCHCHFEPRTTCIAPYIYSKTTTDALIGYVRFVSAAS